MLMPRNIVVLLLRAYRFVISPLYGDVCRYYPSCSAYALEATQEHGVLRGSWLAARRLARCHPWAEGGIDDVPLRPHSPYRRTRFGFVVVERKG
jgi:uncharacterized protein